MIPIFSLLQVLTAEEVDVTGVEGEEVIVGAMEVEEDAEAVEVMEVEDAVEGSDIFSGAYIFFHPSNHRN